RRLRHRDLGPLRAAAARATGGSRDREGRPDPGAPRQARPAPAPGRDGMGLRSGALPGGGLAEGGPSPGGVARSAGAGVGVSGGGLLGMKGIGNRQKRIVVPKRVYTPPKNQTPSRPSPAHNAGLERRPRKPGSRRQAPRSAGE